MKTYTIGQVSAMTGIKKRIIKYYVEKKLIIPSDKISEGKKSYWLYSDEDVLKIKQITLYRELGYSVEEIQKLVGTPDFDWRYALDQQIEVLKKKKQHIENLIFAAEFMRYVNEVEKKSVDFDISDFDNDIDKFAITTLAVNEDEITEKSLEKFSEDIAKGLNISDVDDTNQKVFEIIIRLRESLKYGAGSTQLQESVSELFESMSYIFGNTEIDPYDILFGLRLISNISMDRIIDLIFAKEEATVEIFKAVQIYIDKNRR